ncbi:MAG: HAD hydrolase-like protein [Gammaproteobacteria bacterium]|nr:HAD hydrolase-like protein [Gammaproteobacteria bacterium]
MPEPRGKRAPAIPGRVLERLRRARGFVCDMDGTLVLGDRHNKGLRPLPGAIDFIAWLNDHHLPFVLFTNGTTRTPLQYAQTLQSIGFPVTSDNLMTPVSSALDLFLRRGHRRVMVLGGDGLKGPLANVGIDIVPATGVQKADAVLVGWFREFTMNELEAGVHAVWGGARLYSSSQSLFFASAEGRTLGSSRAISAMIRDLTGTRVEIVGKPSLHALGSAGRRLGVRLKDLAVIGDDPSLEIPMAHRGHALAIAVHTGIGDGDAFAGMPARTRPHLTVHNIAELLALCRRFD